MYLYAIVFATVCLWQFLIQFCFYKCVWFFFRIVLFNIFSFIFCVVLKHYLTLGLLMWLLLPTVRISSFLIALLGILRPVHVEDVLRTDLTEL